MRYSKGAVLRAVTVIILLVIAVYPLLRFKLHSGHEAFAYFPRLIEFDENVKDGVLIPRWAPDLSEGYGQPIFIFISPLVYYLGEVFHLMGLGFVNSVNAACLLLIIISFFGMYGYASEFFGKRGGMIAAIAYIYAPYFMLDLYVRYALSEFAAFAFYPLILWSVYRLSKKADIKYIIAGILSWSFLVLSDHSMALLFAPVFVAYAIYLYFFSLRTEKTAFFLSITAMIQLVLMLTAFSWLPMLIERDFIDTALLSEMYSAYTKHFLYIRQIIYSSWGYGFSYEGINDGLSFGLGVVHILLSAASLFLLVKTMIRKAGAALDQAGSGHIAFFIITAAAAVFFTLKGSKFIWDAVKILHPLSFPWRFLSLAAFSTAFLGGSVIRFASDEKGKNAIFFGAIGMLLLFNAAHTIPEKYYSIDEAGYTPRKISSRRLWTAAKGAYDPKWVKKRAAGPSPSKLELKSGRIDIKLTEESAVYCRYDIIAKEKSAITLNTNYFPGWKAYLNGQLTDTYLNEYGHMEIYVPEGEYILEVRFINTPVRSLSEAVSGSGFLVLLIMIVIYSRRWRNKDIFSGIIERLAEKKLDYLFVSVIAVSVAAVFSNTLMNSFHLDDFSRIVHNPQIEKFMPFWRHFFDPGTMATLPRVTQYRPMLPLSLSVNYAISGHSLAGYHIVNILLHMAVCILVYFMVVELIKHAGGPQKNMRENKVLAFAVTMLFAVHPVSGIPVNYISARDLLMMYLFFTLAFLLYMRMRRTGYSVLKWVFVMAAYVLSLLSKPNAVAAPVFILLFESIIRKEDMRRKTLWLNVLPFAAAVLIFGLYIKFFLHAFPSQKLALQWSASCAYALKQAKIHLFNYIPNFFWPFSIHSSPRVEPASLKDSAVIAGITFIISSISAAWLVRKKSPLVSFSILVFWLLLALTSSIIPLVQVRRDFRPYSSSVFFFIVICYFSVKYLPVKIRRCLFFLAFIYLALSSFFMNRIWKTEATLNRHSVSKSGSALAYHNLGMSTADLEKRKEYFEKAIALSPNYILAKINLGLTLIYMGDVSKGIDYCREAVEMDPSRGQSHYWLAVAYESAGMKKEALGSSITAADLNPRDLRFLYKAAINLKDSGEYGKVLKYTSQIIRMNPIYKNTLFIHGFSLQMTGDNDGAIESYRRFLKSNPEHSQAWFNLGYALMKRGGFEQAIDAFHETLALNPGYTEAHAHLAECYKMTGNLLAFEEHIKIYKKHKQNNLE
ncbi:MAG: tetratricopeptide repeat protein [Elusimicrobia bacterium]|nr:tetratricopeptide repeat protein [Elusimicrobiota bacterium]